MSLNVQLTRRITLDGLDPITATRNLLRWINLGIGEDKNVALGHKSQVNFDKKNLVGYNVGIGYECLYYNQTGQYNVAIGYECLRGGETADGGTVNSNLYHASKNVAIGYQCAQFIGGSHTNTNSFVILGTNNNGRLGTGNTTSPTQITYNSTNLNIAQISCGENHSGFVTEDGKLYMFGSNENYQLGLGNTNETTSPTLVPNHTQGSGFINENIISVECGNSYTIIIKKEGNNYYRYVFGLNSEGQLGNNSTTTVQVPKKQDWGQSNISKISTSIRGAHTILLKSNGEAHSFGRNDNGQLGHGDNVSPHIHPTSNSQISNYSDITHISCGKNHSAIIRSDNNGTLYTFGKNSNGQLGLGDTTNRNIATLVSGYTNIIDVKCGEDFTIFLKSDGSIYSFGYNQQGQLGVALNYSTFLPTNVPQYVMYSKDIIEDNAANTTIDCALDSVFILLNNGLVYVIGNNNNNILGYYDNIDRNYYLSLMNNVKNISLMGIGSEHALLFKSNDRITNVSSENVIIGHQCALSSMENKYIGINNTYIGDQCGKNNVDGSNNIGIGYKCLLENTIGEYNTALGTECLYLNTSGNYNTSIGYKSLYNNNGDSNTAIGYECSYFNMNGINNVSIGYHNFRGTTNYSNSNNNTLIGYKCGEEISGSCSNNIIVGYKCGTNINNVNNNILMGIECGKFMNKVNQNIIESCGTNSYGGLGIGFRSDIEKHFSKILLINEIISNNNLTITKIDNGQYHTAILLSNNNLYLFGRNNYGQLGNSNIGVSILEPKLFPVYTDIIDVACGLEHTLILRQNGTVYGFGKNDNGQLGIGNYTETISTPTLLNGGYTDITKIFCGDNYSAIIRDSNVNVSLWMFGNNEYGQLGIENNKTNVNIPTAITVGGTNNIPSNDNILDVACGLRHTLVNRNETFTLSGGGTVNGGVVYSCGRALNGRLGNNTTSPDLEILQKIPDVQSNGIYTFRNEFITDISVGTAHSIIASNITTYNSNVLQSVNTNIKRAYTFGYNQYGQLGNGELTSVLVPTQLSNYEDIIKIDAGSDHSIIIRGSSNDLYSFGRNNNGQLGDETFNSSSIPVFIRTGVDKVFTNFNKLIINSRITDINNILVGNECGKGTQSNNFEGVNCVYIGNLVGRLNTTGSENVALGNYSLFNNSSGTNNISIGTYALFSNNTSNNNIGIGNSALFSNTTGANNVSVGYQSLYSNTTASNNVGIGDSNLYSNTTGENNVSVGKEGLYLNTIGANNVM